MGENFMYYKTAKEIWDATRGTYSNKDNTSAIFEIKGILYDQGKGKCLQQTTSMHSLDFGSSLTCLKTQNEIALITTNNISRFKKRTESVSFF